MKVIKHFFRFCISLPSLKDENGKFVPQEFLPEVSSEPKLLNEFFDSKIIRSSERRSPAAEVSLQPSPSSPGIESESSTMVSSTESCNQRLQAINETEAENLTDEETRESSGDQMSHLDLPPPSVQIISEESCHERPQALTETEEEQRVTTDLLWCAKSP